MKKVLLPLVLLPLFGLPACSYLNMTTANELRELDPMAADPGKYFVTIDMPEDFGLEPGSAVLSMSGERTDTGETLSGSFALAQAETATGQVQLALAEADLPRFRGLQSQMRDWKEAVGDKASGSFGFDMTPCRRVAAPRTDGDVSVAVVLEPGASPLPLISNVPVHRILDGTEPADLPQC